MEGENSWSSSHNDMSSHNSHNNNNMSSHASHGMTGNGNLNNNPASPPFYDTRGGVGGGGGGNHHTHNHGNGNVSRMADSPNVSLLLQASPYNPSSSSTSSGLIASSSRGMGGSHNSHHTNHTLLMDDHEQQEHHTTHHDQQDQRSRNHSHGGEHNHEAADTPSQYFRSSPSSAARMTSSSSRDAAHYHTQEAIPPSPYPHNSHTSRYPGHGGHHGGGAMGPPKSAPTPLHVKSNMRNSQSHDGERDGGGGDRRGGVRVTVDKAAQGEGGSNASSSSTMNHTNSTKQEEHDNGGGGSGSGSGDTSEGNHKLPRPVLLFSPSPKKVKDNHRPRGEGGGGGSSNTTTRVPPPMSSPSDRIGTSTTGTIGGERGADHGTGGAVVGEGGMHPIGPSPLKSKLSTPGPIRRTGRGADHGGPGGNGSGPTSGNRGGGSGGDLYSSSAYSDPYGHPPPPHGSYPSSSSHKSGGGCGGPLDYYDRPMVPSPFSHPREYMGMQASRMAYEYDRTYSSKSPRSGSGGGGHHGSPYGPDGGWGRGDSMMMDRKPLGNLNWSEPRERGAHGGGGGSSDFGTMEDYKDENGRGFMVSPAIAVSRRGGSKRRSPYDLHDQSFNEGGPHASPSMPPRNASAVRYCTPIVTGGNDRNRGKASDLKDGGSGGKGPSHLGPMGQPIHHDDYHGDSHMRYYHRPYPSNSNSTSGGMGRSHSSPNRYDDSPHHRHGSPMASAPMQTPNVPGGERGASGPVGGPPPNHHAHGHPGMRGGRSYYDPMNTYPPHSYHHHDPYHPAPHPHHPQHNPHPPGPYLQNGAGFFSPYDPRNPSHARHPKPMMPTHAPTGDYHSMPPASVQAAAANPSNPPKKRRLNTSDKPRKASVKPPRRKKMYSDFVGVTYNKTHAKFQACITHYRKQYYLGRYKLAVDAAKAYDESAKVLKGEGWKINFQTEEAYELAKMKEIESNEKKRKDAQMGKPPAVESSFDPSKVIAGLVKRKADLDRSSTTSMSIKKHVGQKLAASQNRDLMANENRLPLIPGPSSSSTEHMVGIAREVANEHKTLSGHESRQSTMQPSEVRPNNKSAVTPSPNVQAMNKSQLKSPMGSESVLKENISSPLAILPNGSPSVDSMFKSTPPSVLLPKDIHKSCPPTQQLDEIPKNIFSSPLEKMGVTVENEPHSSSASPLENQENETKKNVKNEGGALDAASALLMISN